MTLYTIPEGIWVIFEFSNDVDPIGHDRLKTLHWLVQKEEYLYAENVFPKNYLPINLHGEN